MKRLLSIALVISLFSVSQAEAFQKSTNNPKAGQFCAKKELDLVVGDLKCEKVGKKNRWMHSNAGASPKPSNSQARGPTPMVIPSLTPSASPIPAVASSLPATFPMPFFTDRIGKVKSEWSHSGFILPPIVIQDAISPGLACKPVTENDIIIRQEPTWKTLVSSDVQVTLTLLCDAYIVSNPQTPEASSALIPTPLPTPSEIPTPTTSAPSASASKQCYVSGYTKKNGTHVSGYYRSC
jgi:hypothetical protein